MKLTIPENKTFKIPETTYECNLMDDGSLDTIIEVDGIEHRFDGEYTSFYRDKNGAMTEKGFIELCKECIEEYEEHWK
jgi:hypothetical protein